MFPIQSGPISSLWPPPAARSLFFAGWGWVFGLVLAFFVAIVIMGGIQSIARVTEKLVPFMALLYIGTGLFVIASNANRIPAGLVAIVEGAFSPEGLEGGAIGVLILGFRRAAFSNEAGIGSSSIAHAAVRTGEPITQGFVAMLEPFIDTLIVCSITALVIVTAFDPGTLATGEVNGVFADVGCFRTSCFLVPPGAFLGGCSVRLFNVDFLVLLRTRRLHLSPWTGSRRSDWFSIRSTAYFGVIGCTTSLVAILDFTDAMIFAMAFANLIGLFVFAPTIRSELDVYWSRVAARR